MDMVLVTMWTCNFRTLRSNIFAKTIKFVKLFLPVHMGPMSNLLSKTIMIENLVTLSLSVFVDHDAKDNNFWTFVFLKARQAIWLVLGGGEICIWFSQIQSFSYKS